MRNLIPNDVTVSEQFRLIESFNQAVQKWHYDTYGVWLSQSDVNVVTKRLEEDFGITCIIKNDYTFRALSPKVVDERKYLFFMLRYQ